MEEDSLYIKHILDAIIVIETYIENLSFETFSQNKLVQDGVIRELEIIGETVKRLSEDLKNLYLDIPWKDIAGMRDKLIHDYFGVDLEAVWRTAQEDLSALKNVLS
ncbi:MAG: DUF86 domain-containing protein [bacterium]|nr:DUF86 domain-containing protein [bacterium]